MAGVTGRLHVEALKSQDSSAVDESEGAGAGRVEGQDVEEGRPLANRECGERSLEQALKLANDAFNVESILTRMKVDLEGEKKAVQELYDNCVAEDAFFYCGLTKESIWEGCFGPLYDASEQVNITCIARVYDRYGCLPSQIQEGRAAFITSRFCEACQRINQMSDTSSLLILDRMKLIILPPGIENLSGLKYLSLEDSQISALPTNVMKLKALIGLNCKKNAFTRFPDEICQLENLVHLSIEHNQIETLPAEIGQLQALTHLTLKHNKLILLPADIGKLKSLVRLILGDNHISDLPEELQKLQALIHLELDHNQFSYLPKVVKTLTNLTYLSFRYNKVSMLPSGIKSLVNLKYLYFDNNRIRVLPESLEDFESLEFLSVADNLFTRLPCAVLALKSLRYFYVDNDQLLALSVKDLSVKPSHIITITPCMDEWKMPHPDEESSDDQSSDGDSSDSDSSNDVCLGNVLRCPDLKL